MICYIKEEKKKRKKRKKCLIKCEKIIIWNFLFLASVMQQFKVKWNNVLNNFMILNFIENIIEKSTKKGTTLN